MIIEEKDLKPNELPVNRIVHGDALSVLKKFPSESVDCVITSPPYWGKRYYPETEKIWGGDPNCDHEWVEFNYKFHNAGGGQDYGAKAKEVFPTFRDKGCTMMICEKCGAHSCQLGLEPTPELYVEHLIEIFREVKRVLKPHGNVFVVIDDSVIRDVEMLIKVDGIIKKVRIGDFIDEYIEKNRDKVIYKHGREIVPVVEDIEILSLDDNYRVVWSKPSCFIRHRVDKKIVKVNIAGSEICMTTDHSLISPELGCVKPSVGAKALRVFKYPAMDRDSDHVLLPLDNLQDCFITWDGIETIIEKHKDVLKNFAGKYLSRKGEHKNPEHRVYLWKFHKYLPVPVLLKLIKSKYIKEIPKSAKVYAYKSHKLPVYFPLNDIVLKFFGLWIADGSYDRVSVKVSCGVDEELVNLCKAFTELFGLKLKRAKREGDVLIHSATLKKVMMALGFKGYSSERRVPQWVFNLSRRQIGYFLSGYLAGDGYVSSREIAFGTVNKKLRDDIADLFCFLGINVTYTQGVNKSGFGIGSVTYYGHIHKKDARKFLEEFGTILRKDKNLIVHFEKNAHIPKGDCKIVEVKEMQEIEYTDYVYDISVPKFERFIANRIVLHNTYSGSGAWNWGNNRRNLEGEIKRPWTVNAKARSPVSYIKHIPRKSLCLVPELFTIRMVYDLGFILRNKIIWAKKVHIYKDKTTIGNAMPESTRDRLCHTYEVVYHFVKEPRYYYDLDVVRVPHKETKPSGKEKYKTLHQGLFVSNYHPLGANPGDVIQINTQPFSMQTVKEYGVLREDLTDEEREYVIRELKKAKLIP